MSYASLDDLISRFGEAELRQLTDDLGTGQVDPAKVAVALADAAETINSYVAGRYAIPLAPVPDLVRRWACDIARYYLHRETDQDSTAARNYSAAVAGLKDVAKGLSSLEAAGAVMASSAGDDDNELGQISGGGSVMAGADWGL